MGNLSSREATSYNPYVNILDLFFRECPYGVIYRDKNLRYITANKAFCNIFKIENTQELIGKSHSPFLSKENAKLVQEIDKAIIQEGQSLCFVMSLDNSEKSKVLSITSSPIIQDNKFFGIFSIVKDVTSEEKLKERFVSKHFQLKSLFENIPMLIYMQDRSFNYIAGTKPSQNFVKDGLDSFSNIRLNLEKYIEEDKQDNNYVIANNKTLVKEKNLEDFKEISHWYQIYKVPIREINGNVSGVITVAKNIDAEKQLQAQRETFVASLGHDLKNPTIAQIRGLELLLKGEFGSITDEQREIAEMILDSCRYMNGMLSTLLATYRNFDGVAKLKFTEFSFSDLVMECVSEMIYVAKDKNLEISVDTKLESDTVIADRVQLKRVIMNLLSNGIKYAYKETSLNLKIFTENEKNCFEFENKSPYIPQNKQKAIFAQYVSYASAHNELGIGLGLYTSKKIIEAHNGNIYVQSYKDDRNCFGFKIPIHQKRNCCEKSVCF